MNIFTPPAEPANKPEISEAAKIAITKGLVLNAARGNFQQLCAMQRSGINQVWHNPQGLTPQQAVDSLGPAAGKIFVAHGKLTELIVTLAAMETPPLVPDILMPTAPFQVNEDGTVTINP